MVGVMYLSRPNSSISGNIKLVLIDWKYAT